MMNLFKNNYLQSFLVIAVIAISFAFTSLSEVFICDSSSATKYHLSSSCRGLNACKYEIVKVSKEDAVSGGRTLCGWED